MWMNDQTAWTWRRLWPLEDAFWTVARDALTGTASRTVLAQAARSMLLAQSSDWQFIISTGAAADYAERRFTLHCDDAETLLAALRPGADAGALEEGVRRAAALRERDDLFPGVLEAVAGALA
jgi:1,4-alpha-glucan branching enzyme